MSVTLHPNWSASLPFDREDSLANEFGPSETVLDGSSLPKDLYGRIEIAEDVHLLCSG